MWCRSGTVETPGAAKAGHAAIGRLAECYRTIDNLFRLRIPIKSFPAQGGLRGHDHDHGMGEAVVVIRMRSLAPEIRAYERASIPAASIAAPACFTNLRLSMEGEYAAFRWDTLSREPPGCHPPIPQTEPKS